MHAEVPGEAAASRNNGCMIVLSGDQMLRVPVCLCTIDLWTAIPAANAGKRALFDQLELVCTCPVAAHETMAWLGGVARA